MASVSVLLDTNLLIGREDPKALESDYAALLQLLSSNGVQFLVHPLSLQELEGDRNLARRKMVLSKVHTYDVLDPPPVATASFLGKAGPIGNGHDRIDVQLLYSVATHAAGFLLTQDQDLVQRALGCNLADRVFTIADAREYFSTVFGRSLPAVPAFLNYGPVYNLNIEDPFFDTLKKDYPEFSAWFQKIALERRKCLAVTDSSKQLAALMIIKEEEGTVDGLLPKALRLKISTLKVDSRYSGIRLGELLLAFGLAYCARNKFGECYLTAFPTHPDILGLTSVFGFRDIGSNGRGEHILLKSFRLEASLSGPTPFEQDRLAFPRFHDGPSIRKFLVPVQPPYHSLLFPDYRLDRRQRNLDAFLGPALPAGNAIRKAYISRSPTSLVRAGDILLFYRSEDAHAVTHAGIVESTKRSADPVALLEFVGNRTVLPIEKIREMCDREAIAMLFWSVGQVAEDSPGVPLADLGIPHPQTVSQIDEEKYQELKGRWHLISG